VKSTVFIVEDSRTMRSLVRTVLERDGYEVRESPDGRQALAALHSMSPDLVITDINMPEMDGITLLREIRKLPALHHTPVLILTTESDDEVKASARAAGATGWIGKPFHPDQLREVVARVLERGRPG
jgi:two-component system, chemotaxis family, chemotaxis protein CheY